MNTWAKNRHWRRGVGTRTGREMGHLAQNGPGGMPEVLRDLPKALHNIFESPITVGAFCAILLNIFLPEEFIELEKCATPASALA